MASCRLVPTCAPVPLGGCPRQAGMPRERPCPPLPGAYLPFAHGDGELHHGGHLPLPCGLGEPGTRGWSPPGCSAGLRHPGTICGCPPPFSPVAGSLWHRGVQRGTRGTLWRPSHPELPLDMWWHPLTPTWGAVGEPTGTAAGSGSSGKAALWAGPPSTRSHGGGHRPPPTWQGHSATELCWGGLRARPAPLPPPAPCPTPAVER